MAEHAPELPPFPERRYERAPVIEALCELYFTQSTWNSTLLEQFYDRVQNDYPVKSQLDQIGVEFCLEGGQASTRPLLPEPRMRYAKSDNSALIQLGRDLLVVNQLPPYTHYEDWRDRVLTSLEVYRDLFAPTGIDRFGLRYINKVELPHRSDSFFLMEDYFRVYPHVPKELSGAHGPFMLQLLMIPVCKGHHLTLTLGMNPPDAPNTTSILVDLYDVVQLRGNPDYAEVRRLMDEAHANIIHTFENSITDASRKLFGEITHE